jgi:hypothetical protein
VVDWAIVAVCEVGLWVVGECRVVCCSGVVTRIVVVVTRVVVVWCVVVVVAAVTRVVTRTVEPTGVVPIFDVAVRLVVVGASWVVSLVVVVE